MNANTYLGYGVRAEHDAALNQIVLKVEREDGVHYIALTADEIAALNDFAKRFPPLTGY